MLISLLKREKETADPRREASRRATGPTKVQVVLRPPERVACSRDDKATCRQDTTPSNINSIERDEDSLEMRPDKEQEDQRRIV